MGKKPKVGGVAKRPTKKAKRKAKEKPQRERFIEAAREVGVDETGNVFERALARILKAKKRPLGTQ